MEIGYKFNVKEINKLLNLKKTKYFIKKRKHCKKWKI